MLFHVKETLRNWIIRLFMASKNDLTKITDNGFSFDGYTQKHIANTSIITVLEKEGDTRFFRECRRHCDMGSYVFTAIEDYFDRVSSCSQANVLKQAVLNDLKQPAHFKRLSKIGGVFNRHLMEILCGIYGDYAAVGTPSFGSFNEQEEFISFVKYISGVIISHKTNTYIPVGMHENFSANKQLATYQLAQLLGVESLIPKVQVCRFEDDTVCRIGTLMEKAPGYPPSNLTPEERTNLEYTSFLKDITNLEYLDALCYQLDHRLDNYYVVENADGKIANVVAFDNDAARTFFVSSKLPKKTYAGCSGVLAKDGTIARPYMDRDFARLLSSLDEATLKQQLGTLMSQTQLHCIWKRIQLLQKAAEKTAAANPEFLVSDWGTIDPQQAADSRYGCTYYELYLTDTLMLDREVLFEKMRQQN